VALDHHEAEKKQQHEGPHFDQGPGARAEKTENDPRQKGDDHHHADEIGEKLYDQVFLVVRFRLVCSFLIAHSAPPDPRGASRSGTKPVYTNPDALSRAGKRSSENARAPYIILTNPINRLNYQGVDAMVALAEQTGFDAISFSPFKTNRGEMTRYALSSREQTDLCNHMTKLRKQIRAQGLGENIGRLLARYEFNPAKHRDPCYICWYHSRIKVDGTVLSCGRSELMLGDLKKEIFPEIWNGKAYRMERRKRMSPHSFSYRNKICDCEHCAYVQDNLAIHRRLKYLLPLFSRFKEGTEQSPQNKDFV
jgi:hypothetical protein